MRLSYAATLLLLLGCTDGISTGPISRDSGDADGCPEGLSAATSADATITNFVLNGRTVFIGYEADATLSSGQPAACISDDRRLAQWILSDLDGPEVVLRQSVVEWGTQLLDGSSGALTMEVIGVETVQTQDWLTGFWTADLENDGRVLTNINSTAVTEQGGNYTITGALEIYR